MIPEPLPVLTIRNKHVLNAGLLMSLINVLIQLVQNQFASASEVSSLSVALGGITLILSILVLVQAMKKYKDDELDGRLPFGRAFRFGFLACIILGLVIMVFTYIFYKFINPTILNEMLNTQIAALEKNGTSSSDLENIIPYIEKFISPGPTSIMTFFVTLIYGIIYSLIAAAFTNNDKSKSSL